MTIKLPPILVSAMLLLALPAVAMAHTGAGATHGFAHGFGHPISGIDHIAAMVLVGALGWQIGGSARWLLPTTFVLCMALGGVAGVSGLALPLVEIGIASSIIVLGLMIAFSWKASIVLTMAIVGAGAIFHGYAHGLEMPESAGGLQYALGFMMATTLLHIGGLVIGLVLVRSSRRGGVPLLRTAGALAALLGVGILAGAV